jgi:hypothetical protein
MLTATVPAQDWDDYEWDPTWGMHEEEWYDPSDWFDTDEGVEYEDYGWLGTDDYAYDYDSGVYDGGVYDAYDYDYDPWEGEYEYEWEEPYGEYEYEYDPWEGEEELEFQENYYTDDWYEYDDEFNDWYDDDWWF